MTSLKDIVFPLILACVLCACTPYDRHANSLDCQKQPDWSDRKVCQENAKRAEQDWEKLQKQRSAQ